MRQVLVLALLAVLGTGCVSYCDRVADFERQWRERSATAEQPHLRMAVPYALVDRLLAERVREIDPVRMALGDFGALSLALADVRVSVASVRLRHADADHVGFAIALDVGRGEGAWFTMLLDAQVEPRVEERAITIGWTAADLQRVEPVLAPGARERLAAALRETLPDVVSERIDEAELLALSEKLLAYAVSEGYEQLRRTLLADLGEVARVRLALPELPLRGLSTRSLGEPVAHLVVDGITDRPVSVGVGAPLVPAVDAIRVRLSGDTVAELGNWAVEQGLLPARYDGDMKPDPEGRLRPLFDWSAGAERPFVVQVLSDESPCFRLVVEARAEATLAEGELEVRMRDGVIRSVDGSWLTELGVWLDRVGEGPIETTQRQLARVALDLHGRPLSLRAVAAALDAEGMTVDLAAGWDR